MLRRNLTAKILVAVGLTVAIVIAIYTYFVIRVQSAWWHERTQAQNLISASMLHEYLNGVMLSDRHEEVQKFLLRMRDSGEIRRGRIIKPDGTVVFSTETQEIERAVMSTPPSLFGEGRILQGERVENGERLSVAMRPVAFSESCQKCHDSRQQFLGAIVLERSLAPAEANIATNRNLLIVYGVVIFVLVGIVLWLLIVRLVSQPVTALLGHMRRVEHGDLSAHAEVQSPDEIGELARDFNAMVRSLEVAKRELHASHEKQMQQAGKLASIGELASGIAHEIRNPLAGIGAAMEVLTEEKNLNGQREEIVGEIRRQIARLNSTLRDLLDFARQREPEIVACDVQELIKPMLALVRPDAQKQHITVAEQYAPSLPSIRADAGQVQQALLNVLLNAVQAMPDGGSLIIDASFSKDLVQIRISDTGVGIPAENLQKLFSPFFTTKHRGTGLGLTITRMIMGKNGGAIRVESEVGRGTTFILEFQAFGTRQSLSRLGHLDAAPLGRERGDVAENGALEVMDHGAN
ncbi:MAG TPA: ATP-binding protein [Verrucomicrobiae bacterium]|nr:ATP-binding protein [Verrucomicrobiae bacterium]